MAESNEDLKSEVATLRKAVHALAEALQPELLTKCFAGTGGGFNSLEFRKFAELVRDVLKKTS